MTNKQFTKDDLKTGMVIKYRGGDTYANLDAGLRLVLGCQVVGSEGYTTTSDFSDHLYHKFDKTFDIVEVFEVVDSYMGLNYFRQWELKSIWKREEKSPEQIEIENIQSEMDKLNKRLGELKNSI